MAFQVTHDLPSSLLVASSPLSFFLSRRALQDSFTGLLLLVGVWAVHLESSWLLAVAVALALISREAVLLYVPAYLAAWILKSGAEHWIEGAVALAAGTASAVMAYYAAGGRKLVAVFRKLRQTTDYVRRFQSGMPHRILVDLALVSPVVLVAVLVNWGPAPSWLFGFVAGSVAVHAFITPKNVRFLLVVDIVLRMMCASLPEPWSWAVLVTGSVMDLLLYRAFGKCEDPVTLILL